MFFQSFGIWPATGTILWVDGATCGRGAPAGVRITSDVVETILDGRQPRARRG
jgi:hypothetical protein